MQIQSTITGAMPAISFAAIAASAALIWPANVHAEILNAVPQVRIFAWAKHDNCHVRYTYVVQNNGAYPIRRLLIGLFQPDAGNGAADLNVLPQLNGSALWLASANAASPPGWNVKAYFPEDSKKFALEWIASTYHAELWPGSAPVPLASLGAADQAVMPGTSASHFSVLLTQIDHAYVQGRANLDYGDASLNLRIEKGDVTAPTLALGVTQVRPRASDVWAAFDVSVKMTDNYDPAPRMARPTVIANQPLPAQDYAVEAAPGGWRIYFRNVEGRAYQAQFIAKDATGNATLRTLDYVGKAVSPYVKK